MDTKLITQGKGLILERLEAVIRLLAENVSDRKVRIKGIGKCGDGVLLKVEDDPHPICFGPDDTLDVNVKKYVYGQDPERPWHHRPIFSPPEPETVTVRIEESNGFGTYVRIDDFPEGISLNNGDSLRIKGDAVEVLRRETIHTDVSPPPSIID